jgi:competence protein CoiA
LTTQRHPTRASENMLSAKRKSDGQIVAAYFERKDNGPFECLGCKKEVMLKTSQSRINHFAHVNPIACKFFEGESETHRRCKMEIYEALKREPHVRDVVLERPLGTVRPDVSAYFNDVPVAIEVQISSLAVDTITRRTIEYHRKGVYVLWLLQWTPKLDAERYNPQLWEKWVHAVYFGKAYYWIDGLSVAC